MEGYEKAIPQVAAKFLKLFLCVVTSLLVEPFCCQAHCVITSHLTWHHVI